MADFAVRPMRREDLDTIRQWASLEHWNPGLHDGDAFFAADPNGFFLGESDGSPAVCISCVAYGTEFGFLGQYIARPEHRGKGFGLRVWKAGMEHLGDRNVGLDGVLDQQANYEKSGFRFAHHHIRYHAGGGGEAPAGTVPLGVVSFDEVLRFDRVHFPADRGEFLRHWIRIPGSTALGCLENGRLAGYGVIRPSMDGMKIGPLFANDPDTARTLFRSLLAAAAGRTVAIDMPEPNPETAAFVREFQLVEQFRTARMYTKTAPDLPLHQIYGATTLELG